MSTKTTALPPRTLHVAASVHAHWERDGRSRFELGFLVGHRDLLGVDDAALAAVKIPSEAPDLDHDIEYVRSFEDLSIDWVQEIAKQVDRLLPGGIDILGMYVASTADARAAVEQASVYLRAVATALALPSEFQSATAQAPEHYAIVHISTKNSAKTAKCFSSLRDAARTSSASMQLTSPSSNERLTLTKYTSSVELNESIAYSHLSTKSDDLDALVEIAEKRIDELQQQLQPFVQRVWSARGVVIDAEGSEHRVELVSGPSTEAAPKATSGRHVIGRCRGMLQCVAFVPSQTPRAEELATFLLKGDLVKTLLLRIELLLERFTDDATAGDAGVLRDGGVLALPKRGLTSWRSGVTPSCDQLQLSLHAFADDEDAVVVQNALELLTAGDELPGVEIDAGTSSLQWLEEDAASCLDTPSPSGDIPKALPIPCAAAKQTSGGSSFHILVLSVLMLIIAWVFAQRLL